jgi:hypothetical protein
MSVSSQQTSEYTATERVPHSDHAAFGVIRVGIAQSAIRGRTHSARPSKPKKPDPAIPRKNHATNDRSVAESPQNQENVP